MRFSSFDNGCFWLLEERKRLNSGEKKSECENFYLTNEKLSVKSVIRNLAIKITERTVYMKPGRISESVYKRSVLKRLNLNTEEVYQGPGVGIDACVYRPLGGVCPVVAAGTVTMVKKNIGAIALNRAVNRLEAMGAAGKGAWVNFVFPGWFMESHLKAVMTEINDTAAALGIGISGVHAESVPEMEYPVMTVSAYGEALDDAWLTPKRAAAGMDIVMTKHAGTEGAVILAFEREEELLSRYTLSFVDRIQGFLSSISAVGEAAVAVKHGVKAMHTIGEGGVFGALWEIAEAAGLGLEVDLKQIPIRQETIEVCELFDINPYQIPSTGSMLMVAENGYHLATELNHEGICAKVIGRMTEGNDRLLLNEEEKRFLEPPKMNEILKGLIENKFGG